MGGAGHDEVEIKLRVADVAALRRRLRENGAVRIGRVRERNVLFDTPDRRLLREGKLLRLRWNNSAPVLTFKTPAPRGSGRGTRYKVRRELEFPVARPMEMEAVLEGLGFVRGFQYEKFRTSYRVRGLRKLKLEVDETPIGCFVELEGPRREIDRAARLLGYGARDYITANYFVLYREFCRERGKQPGHMLFGRSRKRG
jgi:adenylate cyclase class 2